MAGLAKNKYELYKCSANESIHFKFVRKEEDLEDEASTFLPEMTHQVFGENESIFGYKDLVVEIYYTAAKLTTYVNLQYITKIVPELHEGLKPDDVIGQLRDVIPAGFLTSRDAFINSIPKDADFKPFGKLVHSFNVRREGKERQFEIYKTGIESPGFRAYHERLQTFTLFYIDAASFIDVDDERWRFFLLFEKYKCNGNPMYAVAGYMTVYNYYAYPTKVRPRVSQVLVLPSFQKMGLCAEMLQTFYNDTYSRKEVLDITVEDPSENFQRVRDYVDVKNCQGLSSFQSEKLLKGFSEEMQKEACEKFKLNKKQARRVYEILRLKVTDMGDKEQSKSYRLDMKRRLNAPFQKNGRDFDKLKKVLQPDEFSATLSSITEDQRHQYLETTFQENVEMYRKVLERLAAS
ncbi:histone acetyltransferase type B catalytic subunit-like [Ostrea edulis]|uniref:histone acetyltransferase type B catalytic subunit-like n=1 Tax=Ostrea edulis TaxID=37623 RepID=UPI0024AF0D85|nr:histone acetyltransferase type B catalytic subunit-like [Ostrea edulis]